MSLDEKEWRKHAFEYKVKYIYDINRSKGMNSIHENKVNNIAHCHLLHDILNPYKRTKYINSH